MMDWFEKEFYGIVEISALFIYEGILYIDNGWNITPWKNGAVEDKNN